ncbi:non-heme iron oxygenase ferredoxin subunit [Aminobacter sp. MSH1]|uniref:non-heme iron oxygenase ferredoxin subunit n=1 Tax=Aminobacter sp. MSH1 TaxID=374606 RepID=UPI000D365414|nr:non-heme iron oxygenase ferredoxin subunit [Aminobacter sp. MSH1]
MSQPANWIAACAIGELEIDDAITFRHAERTFAVYRTETGFYATDGICTHQHALLADGLVMDDIVECPLHQGRFDIRSGKAISSPACVNLQTYPVKEENGKVMLNFASADATAGA